MTGRELMSFAQILLQVERDVLELVEEAKTAHISEYRRRYLEFRRQTLLTQVRLLRQRWHHPA